MKAIREKMLELIKLRSQMLSGNLPVDEMKDIKLKAASEIDTGNKLLGKVIDSIYYSLTRTYAIICKWVREHVDYIIIINLE